MICKNILWMDRYQRLEEEIRILRAEVIRLRKRLK